MTINKELLSFDKFVNDRADNRIVEITGNGEVINASKTSNAFMRFFGLSADAREAKEINNRVREAFVMALKKQFNVNDFAALPESVRAALVGSNASTAEGDFGFDANGRVKSGKPLTARRIGAVMDAVKQIRDEELQLEAAHRDEIKKQKLSPKTIEARKAALKPYLESLYKRMTEVQVGYEEPICLEKYGKIAQGVIEGTVKSMLANIGNQKTLSDARKMILSMLSNCGVRTAYWTYQTFHGERTPGKEGLENLINSFIDDLINGFNEQNPTLRLSDELPPAELA